MRRIICAALILVISFGMWFGWRQFSFAARHLSTSQHNLLPGAGCNQLDARHFSAGWDLRTNGELKAKILSEPGYVDNRLCNLTVTDYRSGDALLLTPKVPLKPHTTYLSKTYYHASVRFDLLVNYFYKNGTSQLVFARGYPYYDDDWSTASTAFMSGDNVVAVQLAYRVAAAGYVRLDGAYLEPTKDVVVPRQPQTAPNLLASVQPHDGTSGQWTPYQDGDNHASFTFTSGESQPFMHVVVDRFASGEAKWEPPPMVVRPGQRFDFSVDYRATKSPELLVEYTHQDGGKQFEVLDNPLPAHDWTHYSISFETPADVRDMFVALVLHQAGGVDSRDYSLVDISRPGPAHFARPLISITFDDGWEAAYLNGARMIERYGYLGTFYINPNVVGNDPAFMVESQLRDLQRRGHQLASHGFDHVDMTAISRPELVRQLATARGYLEKKFALYDLDFATPYGKDDPQVQAVVRDHYRSHRGTESGGNTRQNFDAYSLRALFVQSDTPLSVVRREIDEAKANNSWLILTYHRIEDSKVQSAMITPTATFRSHLNLIKQSGVTVKTVHDALDEVMAQE